MSSYTGWSTNTIGVSTSSTIYFKPTYKRYQHQNPEVEKGNPDRPLAYLMEKEREIKNEEEPSAGMPQEKILFDPKELV